MDTVKIGHRYRHFKGHEYRILLVARDSESQEERVIYQDMSDETKIWDRPLSMFIEEVDKPEIGYKGPRFQYLGE